MKVALFALLIAIGILLSSNSSAAHHSFGGTYDVDKEITLKEIGRASCRERV